MTQLYRWLACDGYTIELNDGHRVLLPDRIHCDRRCHRCIASIAPSAAGCLGRSSLKRPPILGPGG